MALGFPRRREKGRGAIRVLFLFPFICGLLRKFCATAFSGDARVGGFAMANA